MSRRFKEKLVLCCRGGWSVQEEDHSTCPIKLAGAPVVSFTPGWHPIVLIDLNLEVYLLELVHENGQRATWFLDSEYNHLTDCVALLPPRLRSSLLDTLLVPIKSVYDNLLSATHATNEDAGSPLHLISESTIRQAIDLLFRDNALSCNVVENGTFGQQSIRLKPENRMIEFAHLNKTSMIDLWHSLELAICEGHIRCPSPASGSELESCHSFAIHDHRVAFRFVDLIHNFVFYLSITHHHGRISDIYIPAAKTVFTNFSDDARTASLNVAAEYLTHFVTHHREISSYLQIDRHKPAIVCRGFPGMHIGHQLWNDLTAYERLASRLDGKHLPILVVPNAERGSEAYGPLDRLFPEWSGKIDRSFQMEIETLGRFGYRKGYFLFRMIDHYVSLGLR